MKTLTTFIFLLYFAVGCGSGSTPQPPPPPPPPPEVVHPDLNQNKLLTDQELVTPPFEQPAQVDSSYADWVQEKHFKLRSISYDQDFSDLIFLENLLNGKRIIQLGESSHGSKEFNLTKVRLIKYLHQELAYQVIAFESSLLGCHIEDKIIENLSSFSATSYCIFGVWHTREVEELFAYIQQTKATANPLILAGFDVQHSSFREDVQSYSGFILPIIEAFDEQYTDFVEQTINDYFDVESHMAGCYDKTAVDCDYISSHAESVKLMLNNVHEFLEAADESTLVSETQKQDYRMTKLVLTNLGKNLDRGLNYAANTQKSRGLRDEVMASNINGLAEQMYPDKKIMIWAHNEHIAHDFTLPILEAEDDRSMGYYLNQYWGDQLYTVGLYMNRGVSAANDRSPITVSPLINNSLEAIAASLNTAAVFVPFDQSESDSDGNRWTRQMVSVKYWGEFNIQLVPENCYDALIVIDHSSMPEYL